MMRHTILVLDDENRICETLADDLTDLGHLVIACGEGATALEQLRVNNFTVAIVDIRLHDIDGNSVIEQASHLRPELRFIIHTGSLEYAYDKTQLGVAERIEAVLFKPVNRLQNFSDILERIGSVECSPPPRHAS